MQPKKHANTDRRRALAQLGGLAAAVAITLVAKKASATPICSRNSGNNGSFSTSVVGSDVYLSLGLPSGDVFEFQLLGGATYIAADSGSVGQWTITPS